MARRHGAKLLLRIDDLDAPRVREAYIEDIFSSLEQLDIQWDEGPRNIQDLRTTWSQALRVEKYLTLVRSLRSKGHLYACSCSRSDLATLHAAGKAFCGHRLEPLGATGMNVCWRLRIPDPCPVRINDQCGSVVEEDLFAHLVDPVIQGKDGSPAYQLASLCDDVEYGMDLIVRGTDLYPSTLCQTYLAELLEMEAFKQVTFIHHPLLLNEAGMKLSKSRDASSLKAMRDSSKSVEHLHEQAEAMMQDLGL